VSIEQGMIFLFDFGPGLNHMQEGIRTAVVVQSDSLNRILGYPNVIVMPVTTRERPSATYVR
jgi:mRNA-degrading endonuclease toxin of MazEF toxin-antitoxin module